MTWLGLAVNIVAFQAAWLALVLSAADGRTAPGLAAGVAAVLIHLVRSTHPAREAAVLLAAVLIGFAAETGLLRSGLIGYAAPQPAAGTVPVWLLMIWLVFATTLNGSMAWLGTRPLLAAVLGAIFGPLAYLAGEGLGGMEIREPRWLTLAAISAIWLVAMPILLAIARRMKGQAP